MRVLFCFRLVFTIGLLLHLFSIRLNAQKRVILIIADDLGVDYCGFYPEYQDTAALPNIRTLLSRGVLFEQAMSNPVCSPTRSGIFTGRYSFRTGVGNVVGGTGGSNPLDTAEMCIPKILHLADLSINKAQIGKWHLQLGQTANLLNPNRMGYDHYAGNFSGALNSYTNWTKITDGITSTCTNYATTEMTNDAISWLQAQEPSESSFLWLAFNAPHTPYHLPPSDLITSTGLSGATGDINTHPVPYFKASLEALDHEIGRLFDSLRVMNQFDNTDFIFIGDNGNATRVAQIADTSRAKGTVYEYGVHVPMIISGPSVIAPGRSSDALVNTADLFATINELMGITNWQQFIPSNKPVDSKSLFPILSNETDSIRPWSFTELFKLTPDSADGKAIRNKDYKLIRFDYGAEELYQLSLDELEENNLLSAGLSEEAQWNYDYLCHALYQLLDSGIDCPIIDGNPEILPPISFYVSPNPATNQLTINCENPLHLKCIAMDGKSAFTMHLSKGLNTISTVHVTNGMYFLVDENGHAEKIIIQH